MHVVAVPECNMHDPQCTVQCMYSADKTGHLMCAHAHPINPLGVRVTTIGWKLVHLSHGWSNWQSQLANSVECLASLAYS